MLYSFLKTAFRNLVRAKLSSFINVIGLSIALSSCLLICLYIVEEFSYDRHFKDVDRIVRIVSYYKGGNDITVTIETPAVLGGELQNEFGEIEAVTRMLKTDRGFLFSGDKAFQENIIFVDSSFLKVFKLDVAAGSEEHCLTKPRSMIISESVATKMFGKQWRDRDIIGETISIDGKFEYTLSAVFKDFSTKSHFHSNIFVADEPEYFSDARKVYTYALLKENVSNEKLAAKAETAFNHRDWFIKGKYSRFDLQPVADIHLYSKLDEENDNHGTIGNVYAFALIALFLLLICCVNFINLYVANAGTRLKEASVRKTMGGARRELFFQFMLEPLMITAFAMIVSMVLVQLLLPRFNEAVNKNLSFMVMASWEGISVIVAITVIVGLVTGIYPAAYLAFGKGVNSKRIVKGSASAWFQNGLMVGQFVLSGAMIVLTIVAFQQVDLIQNRDPGYEKDKVLVLENVNMLGDLPEMMTFKKELLRINGVEEASISGYTPSQNLWGRVRQTFPGKEAQDAAALPATWLIVDNGFLPTLNIKLHEGVNFTENAAAEQTNVLINETAARQFHLDERGSALNKEISFQSEGGEVRSYRVIGVVKDFNFGSLHESIKPMVMSFGFHRYEMIVRLSSDQSHSVVTEVERLWKHFLPRVAMSYDFLSDRYNKAHEADVAAGKLFSIFSTLNILVACLGLFGLVSYATTRRTKEIGVRKVLGASSWTITSIMSERFVKLVAIAFALSVPLAWTLANQWLSNFAYKVQISVWIFVVTGVMIFLVTLMTVVYITAKAARINPVESLRYE